MIGHGLYWPSRRVPRCAGALSPVSSLVAHRRAIGLGGVALRGARAQTPVGQGAGPRGGARVEAPGLRQMGRWRRHRGSCSFFRVGGFGDWTSIRCVYGRPLRHRRCDLNGCQSVRLAVSAIQHHRKKRYEAAVIASICSVLTSDWAITAPKGKWNTRMPPCRPSPSRTPTLLRVALRGTCTLNQANSGCGLALRAMPLAEPAPIRTPEFYCQFQMPYE